MCYLQLLCSHVDSVFGCDLTKLVEAEGSTVPKFLVRCMEEIETRGKICIHTTTCCTVLWPYVFNVTISLCIATGLDVIGIYRLSGNAAQIQKLRHRTDQGMYVRMYVMCVYLYVDFSVLIMCVCYLHKKHAYFSKRKPFTKFMTILVTIEMNTHKICLFLQAM